jgi:DNA/RNA endonuclease G (NUC1)
MIKKVFLLCVLSYIYTPIFGQYKPDTTIITEAYTSYVNKELCQPLYVKYKLYKGGGDCKRSNNWTNDTKLKLVDENQYKGTSYDRGHLANAEDFAYNCHLDSLTFRDYNRIPQTRKLNRGIWKVSEEEVRKLSQTDSLIIYCGGSWDLSSKEVNGMKIPSKCWKAVYSLSQQKVICCYIFFNTDTPVRYDSDLSNLEAMLGYSLGIPEPTKKKKKKKS